MGDDVAVKSINSKVAIAIIAVLLVALGGSAALSGYFTSSMAEQGIESNLTALSQGLGKEVGSWLETRKAEMNVVANSPTVKTFNQDVLVNYMASEVNRIQIYDFLVYADAQGNYVTSQNIKGNLVDRDYFKKAKETLKPQIGVPVVSRATGKTIVHVSAPIIQNGQFAGIIAGGVNIDYLDKIIETMKVGQTGYAYIVQQDGLVIVHHDENIEMKLNALTDPSLSPELKAAAQKMIQGLSGITEYSFQNTNKYLGYAPIPGTEWSIAVNVPTAEMNGTLKKINTINIIMPIAAIVLAVLLLMWLLKRIVILPVKQLDECMAQAETGDLTARTEISADDEMGRLGDHFNKMMTAQGEVIQSIRHTALELSGISEEMAASAEEVAGSSASVSETARDLVQETEGANQSVIEVSQVLVHLSSLIQIASAKAASAGQGSLYVKESALSGRDQIGGLIKSMTTIQERSLETHQLIGQLSQYSGRIKEIAETITNIANQTNLLALNAAIEAARAGEQGKGFAVVAEEVRKLAEQSSQEAGQVTEIIQLIASATENAVSAVQKSNEEVENGAKTADDAKAALESILEAVFKSVQDIEQINNVTSEQVATSDEVIQLIDRVAQGIEKPISTSKDILSAMNEISTAMEQVANVTSQVSSMAQDLQKQEGRFKL